MNSLPQNAFPEFLASPPRLETQGIRAVAKTAIVAHARALAAIMTVLWIAATPLCAHDQIPGPPQKGPIALVGGTIVPVDAPMIDGGTIVFDSGKIVAVGKRVKVPKKCKIIDVRGSRVYPGLMESMSNLGLSEIGSVRATIDTNELGDDNSNLRPWVAVNPDSELIPVARAGGVLLASIASRRGNLRGQSGVIQLDGWTYRDMLLRDNTGLVISWRGYDSRNSDDAKRADERDARLKQLSDRLEEASRYAEARKATPQATPTDLRLEALLPVIGGQLPVIVEADVRREIEAAVSFCIKHQLRPIIYGGYDAAECSDLLKRYDVPVIIHGTHRLPRRRHEPYDHAYTLPHRLSEQGVRFAIGGSGSGSPGGGSAARNLPYHAAMAVAYGLSPEEAVRSITLSPAEMMGVADRVGSLTEGKDATLIVVSGDILLTESEVTHAFIQGSAVDLGSKQKTLAAKYRTKYKRIQP